MRLSLHLKDISGPLYVFVLQPPGNKKLRKKVKDPIRDLKKFQVLPPLKAQRLRRPCLIEEFTELAKSRFLDCDSCGMTQGALIRNVADCQALYMQTKQPRSDILYMTTLDTGRCSHSTCSLVVLIALYLTIPMAASRSTDSS